MFRNMNQRKEENYICGKCQLHKDMRLVWERHVWWTREVVLSIINGLPGTSSSVNKLLQNPAEMAAVFAPFYAPDVIQQITDLFTVHLKLGGDIIMAASEGDSAKVKELQTEWHRNADDIAKLFGSINPYYDEETVRQMMYKHLELTTNEVILTIEGKYDDAIATFDQIQDEALMMAHYFADGIIRQFWRKF